MKPDIYLVWHEFGYPGTWLDWFINQHKNFPKPAGKYMYNNPLTPAVSMPIGNHRPNPLHFGSSISPWNAPFLKDTDRTNQMVSHNYKSIDDIIWQIKQHGDKSAVQFSKVCLKLQSNHAPMENPMFNKIGFDKIRKEVTIKKNITLVAGTANKLIADRLVDLEKRLNGGSAMIDNNDSKNAVIYFPYLDKLAPTHVVNFGNLLNYDHEEYNKLLIEIDEEPLDNWKELVDIIKEVFTKYK